jgi:hypothetical protein
MTNILNAYGEQLVKWQGAGMAKLLGPKPTAEQLMTYHRLGARHGKQCFAGAMALREHGVTGSEISIACSAPQLNKMRDFINDRLVDRVPVGKRNGGEIYKLVITPKGQKRIDMAIKLEQAAHDAAQVNGEAKPVAKAKVKAKGKATGNRRKAKHDAMVPAAATATVEPVDSGAALLNANPDQRRANIEQAEKLTVDNVTDQA